MKKFIEIYFGLFITLPLLFCIVVYMLACFVTWSIVELDIHWSIIRIYLMIGLIVSFFMAADE
jgi:hypothetical protein